MCQHHAPGHRAVSLDHGAAHDHDHSAWSRRDFLVRSGFGAAAAIALGAARPAHALAGGDLLSRLAATPTDRILVLIQLKGGNDGLNTVVPLGNDLYHNARPSLALGPADTFALASGFGLHGAMAPLQAMWGAGQMAVVHSVGYANSSLSHFTSTDIWSTARASGLTPAGGWGGRTMRLEHPDFETQIPAHPPAVQLGAQNPLLFQSGDSDLSMRISSVDSLATIAAGGGLYNPDDVPPVPYGAELGFARAVANASNTYIGAVQTAAGAGQNQAEYPDTSLGRDLAAIARLIKGGLQSRIYVVSLGSFDTHEGQLTRHATLLASLAGSVAAFYSDLAAGGHDQRTLTMTFSEFGRRVAQNGSAGTDHGTAAPLFAFGPSVAGGVYGQAPDLSSLDATGNLAVTTDFRQAYATALGPWFGVAGPDVEGVLGGPFAALPLIGAPVAAPAPSGPPLVLDPPSPNPTAGPTRIAFRLATDGPARLTVYDALGRAVLTLAEGDTSVGPQSVEFDAARLAAGTYVLRLEGPGGFRTQRLTVVR